MSRFFACAALVLLPSVSFAAADASSRYAQAAQLYEQQRYAEAEEAFRSLLRDDGAHPVVLLGLGNAAYREGHWIDAIYAYEWGLRLSPGDEALTENLKLARTHVLGDAFDASASESSRKAQALLARVPGRLTLLFALVAWTCGWLMLLLRQRGRLEGFTWLAVALVLLAVPALAHAAWQHQRLRGHTEGMLKAPEDAVRSGPGEEYQELYSLHAGTVVEVAADERSGWRRIVLPNKAEGWVKSDQLAIFGDATRIAPD